MSASTRSQRRTASGLIAIATALVLLPLQAALGLAAAGTASASAQLTFAPPVMYQVGASPTTVTSADLNGDGLPDLTVGTDQGVATLLNNGDGTFAHFIPYLTGGVSSFCYGSCVLAANLSGNGLPDIAFARSGGGMGVLLNNGDGTFKAPVFYSSGSGLTIPTSLAVGDLFHDGHQDLALVEVGSFGCCSTLTIFRNQGNGTFTKVLQQGLVNGAVEVTIADLNTDGYPDLITANGNTNGNRTISVYMNLRNGTFAPPVNYVTDGARSVIAADLNNNGLLDLVFPLTQSQGFEVMLNNGDGTFSPPVVFRTPGVWVSSLQAADMYGTGRPDLIGNNGGVGAFVIQNNGNTSFGTPVTVTDGANSTGPVIAADVDGNGDNDLVATDTGSTAVEVLLNQRLPHVDHGLRLSTYHGGNAGTVTLTIFGTGISAGSSSELVCSGQSTLVGTNPVVSPSGTALTATFNLVGATPGQCTAVVVKPDGSTATAAKPFTIDQGGSVQVWVDALGWSQLRAGRGQTSFVEVGNSGNVDSAVAGVQVEFPDFLDWDFDPSLAVSADEPHPGETALSFVLPLAAGESRVVPVTLTAPDSPQYAHQNVQISASIAATSAPTVATQAQTNAVTAVTQAQTSASIAATSAPAAGSPLPAGCFVGNSGAVQCQGHIDVQGNSIGAAATTMYAYNEGFRCDGLATIVAIAGAESGYNPQVEDGNFMPVAPGKGDYIWTAPHVKGGLPWYQPGAGDYKLLSIDWGIWQINQANWPALVNGHTSQLFSTNPANLAYAAQAAFTIFTNAAGGPEAWATYNNNKYLSFITDARNAAPQYFKNCTNPPGTGGPATYTTGTSALTSQVIVSGDPNDKVGSLVLQFRFSDL